MKISPNASPEEQRRLNEYWGNLRNKKKPMQAAPSAQQALPPEIQKLRAQGLAFQQKVMSDPTLTNIRNQQNSLFSTIQQREQSYLSSVREYFKNAPPELQSFFNSPRLINTIMADYRNQQPEMRQINSLGQQYNQYVNTNYGKEQRNLQQQYQNQMQLFNQQQNNAQAAAIKKANEEFRERISRPVQQFQQDPIVDPLRPSTTVPKTITPIERPPVQPIVDPKRKSFTPDQPDVIDDRAPDVKDPFRTPEIAAPTQIKQPPPNLIVDPKREAFTPDTPTSDNKGMVVDPLRPSAPPTQIKTPPPRPTDTDPNNPYKIPMTGPKDPKTPTTPIGDPIKIDTPAIVDPYPSTTTGLMPKSPKKRKASLAPSQYKGIDTNVRGLMRQ